MEHMEHAVANGHAGGLNGAHANTFAPPSLAPTTPAWYNAPEHQTPAERTYVQSFVARVLRSDDYAARIRQIVREQVVPVASTRAQAVAKLAVILGVAPVTANAYLLGLRLTAPHQGASGRLNRTGATQGKRRKRRTGKQGLDKTGGFVATKPASQIRAEAAMRRTIDSDIANMERIRIAFNAMSPAGRQWALNGLNAEIGGSK